MWSYKEAYVQGTLFNKVVLRVGMIGGLFFELEAKPWDEILKYLLI